MAAPRRLVDWPWVTVEIECGLCRKHGRVRLARLAERHGADVELGQLLVLIAHRCGLNKAGVKPRQYEARCEVRYRVPPGGPMPEGAAAREATPGERWPPRPQRLSPDGPLPTVGDTRQQGITSIGLHCYSPRQGTCCHHTATVSLDALDLPDDLPFIHIGRVRRFVCRRCGGREVSVYPLWPDHRLKRAREAHGGAAQRELHNGVWIEASTTPGGAATRSTMREPTSR